MPVEGIAVAVGVALVGIGIWFYLGNGWSGLRNDFFLTYLYMAIPLGLGFIAMGLARSRIAGGASILLVWAAIGLLLVAIILAFTKPATLAPRWLRKGGYMGPAATMRKSISQTGRWNADGASAMRLRWTTWVGLGITVAVIILAAVIEWVKSHGG